MKPTSQIRSLTREQWGFACVIACALLTGCHTNSSGWPVIPFLNNGHSQRAELKPEIVDKYLTPLPDAAFQRPAKSVSRRAALAAVTLPASPWHSMAVTWSDPCDMNHPWIPFRKILSGTNPTALALRVSVTNPLPMRWGMSNGVAYSAFVPVTNGVTFTGQQAEFFQVQ